MSTRWKRNTVVATMAVLVCAAVALNWRYSGETAVQGGQDSDTKILGEATLVSGQDGEQEGSEENSSLPDETGVYTGSDYFASARLTRQQAMIAALLARKTPDTTICDNLNISPSTLKTHIRNIHRRLGISSRHELAWLVTANPAGISETQGGGR